MTKTIKVILVISVLCMGVSTFIACASEAKKAKFIIGGDSFTNATITNSEGKYLKFIENEDENVNEVQGDMKILKNENYEEYEGDSRDLYLLEVSDSDKFTIEPIDEHGLLSQQVSFELINKYNKSTNVFAEYIKKIEINKNTVIITGDERSTFEYRIATYLPKQKNYYSIAGKTTGIIQCTRTKLGIVFSGVKGKSYISAGTKNGEDLGDGYYYLNGQQVNVYRKKGNLVVMDSI